MQICAAAVAAARRTQIGCGFLDAATTTYDTGRRHRFFAETDLGPPMQGTVTKQPRLRTKCIRH